MYPAGFFIDFKDLNTEEKQQVANLLSVAKVSVNQNTFRKVFEENKRKKEQYNESLKEPSSQKSFREVFEENKMKNELSKTNHLRTTNPLDQCQDSEEENMKIDPNESQASPSKHDIELQTDTECFKDTEKSKPPLAPLSDKHEDSLQLVGFTSGNMKTGSLKPTGLLNEKKSSITIDQNLPWDVQNKIMEDELFRLFDEQVKETAEYNKSRAAKD